MSDGERRRPVVTIRWLLVAIAFLALSLAHMAQLRRAQQREATLLAELKAERMRAQAYHRQAALDRVRAIQLESLRLDAHVATLNLQLERERQVHNGDMKTFAERTSELREMRESALKLMQSKQAASHPANGPEARKPTDSNSRVETRRGSGATDRER